MNAPTGHRVLLELDGMEDFHTAINMLHATGAQRVRGPGRGRSNRVFAVTGDLTPAQTAALIAFIDYGRSKGFLAVTVNAPDTQPAEAWTWWHKR
ncbi:hypothetical protein [Streptomyces sp. BH055]|uniref:hypothetical protein n=1 Tax=unclassified Streptomyces TaxID=2593676 RepID=UPI003BB5786B